LQKIEESIFKEKYEAPIKDFMPEKSKYEAARHYGDRKKTLDREHREYLGRKSICISFVFRQIEIEKIAVNHNFRNV